MTATMQERIGTSIIDDATLGEVIGAPLLASSELLILGQNGVEQRLKGLGFRGRAVPFPPQQKRSADGAIAIETFASSCLNATMLKAVAENLRLGGTIVVTVAGFLKIEGSWERLVGAADKSGLTLRQSNLTENMTRAAEHTALSIILNKMAPSQRRDAARELLRLIDREAFSYHRLEFVRVW